MKLKDNFFNIKESRFQGENLEYIIHFNPEHFIYKAHFPDNPVTPGVCIIQTVQELAMEYVQQNLMLKRVSKARFTNVINPDKHTDVKIAISITENDINHYQLNANVYNENLNFAKLALELYG